MIFAESIKTAEVAMTAKDLESEFTLLYDGNIRSLYNFIYYRVGHKETAEDLASTVMLKAWRNFSRFNADKASFKTWLFRIAQNTVIDHFRTFKAAADLESAWEIAEEYRLPQDLDTREKLKLVKSYLAVLSPQEREIVIMRVWDGMAFDEIAELSGKTVSACKMAFYRTLKKIRAHASVPAIILLLTLWKNI